MARLKMNEYVTPEEADTARKIMQKIARIMFGSDNECWSGGSEESDLGTAISLIAVMGPECFYCGISQSENGTLGLYEIQHPDSPAISRSVLCSSCRMEVEQNSTVTPLDNPLLENDQ